MKRDLADILLDEISEKLHQIENWKSSIDCLPRQGEVYNELKGIVELAEIKLCGAIGGCDDEGGQKNLMHYNLIQRANHILGQKKRLKN